MSAAIWCRSLPVSTENSEAIPSFFILCIQYKWKLQTIDLSVVRPYQLHCIIACSNLLQPIQLQREDLGYVHTMPRDPGR